MYDLNHYGANTSQLYIIRVNIVDVKEYCSLYIPKQAKLDYFSKEFWFKLSPGFYYFCS